MQHRSPPAVRIVTEFQPIELPQGHFVLDAAMDDRLRATCQASEREGETAHPIFAFVSGIGGLAVPVAAAIALAGCSMDAGPLLASCGIDIHRPMKVGFTYQVAASITEKQRKASRRFGAADHLLFDIAISHDGVRFVDLSLKMIVPVIAA